MANEVEADVAEAKQLTRDDLRSRIFSKENMTPKVEVIDFNGVNIEFRQPTVDRASDLQSSTNGDNFMAHALIAFSFVPGTDEKVFDQDDYDNIVKMPMTKSFQTAISTISDLLGLSVEDKVKN